jgi:phosphoglycolate phosphatase-like HAD superfamily hydrolase
MSEARIAVLDVDGTLVDTNYQHALAWYRAFRSLGETYPVWRIHRLIGMGGDQLVAALGGDEVGNGSASRHASAGCRSSIR